ncbi:MAG: hypothetical protein HYR70_06265 [Chloroflexi bacterium]|nr:hypothetical protein [Chloroflexota bacterium]MBI3338839.1 hypothetical protein [Chloroflexota bacterium]
MKHRNKTALTIGLIGALLNAGSVLTLYFPVISTILVGLFAGYKVGSEQKSSTEANGKSIGAKAGVIACLAQQIVTMLAIVLFSLAVVWYPGNEEGGVIGIFLIWTVLTFGIPVIIISILIGAVTGAIGGYYAPTSKYTLPLPVSNTQPPTLENETFIPNDTERT